MIKNIKTNINRIFFLFYPQIFEFFLKFKGLFWFYRDYRKFIKLNKEKIIINLNPQLLDKYSHHPNKAGHYLLQDPYVARKIFENNPIKHVDVGSRVDGFLLQLSIFRQIEVFDIRGFPVDLNNITYTIVDFTQLTQEYYNYTDSISSLHALEHFGLGRYGDEVDPEGHIKGIEMIYNVLKPNGLFYFSSPIGPHRVEFNAHRVFSLEYLINLFKPMFEIQTFSYIDDAGIFHENIPLNTSLIIENYKCNYGCGIFILKKL